MRSEIGNSEYYPAHIVCKGGFPTGDGRVTAEVWYRGIKVKGFKTHELAEKFALRLKELETTKSVQEAIECATKLALIK
jgi:hypothetical protein